MSEAAGSQPTFYERILAGCAIVLLALVVVALARGSAEFGRVGPTVWLHLMTVLLALAITPVQLIRVRRDAVHHVLGWIWAVMMFASAVVSLWVHEIEPGHFTPIHLLSLMTIVTVPLLVLAARRNAIARHRRSVRIIVTAALLVAGFFTLLPGRMLGHWLFG